MVREAYTEPFEGHCGGKHYFTACSGYSSYVHNGAVHRVCFELGLGTVIVIQSVLSSRHGLGHYKMPKVA